MRQEEKQKGWGDPNGMTGPVGQAGHTPPDGFTRRRFLKRLTAWTAGALASGLVFPRLILAAPPLAGACRNPRTATEKTLAAVADTLIPGAATDPEGAPGALDACVLNLLLDDAYSFKADARFFADYMDATAKVLYKQAFLDLAEGERLKVLQEAQRKLLLLRPFYRAVRWAFFGGAFNNVGAAYAGYPGPNLGYRHLPEFSGRRAMARELTERGWLP